MNPDLFRLHGQVALITGGGTSLAHAAATALAEAGADTALLYTTGIDDTRKAVAALRRRCMGVQLDLAKATVPQLQGAVQQVSNQLGRLDLLVNCVGNADPVPALECTEKEWEEALRINLRASFFLCQAAGAYFRRQGRGKIINVAPLDPSPPSRVSIAHAACNSGLIALSHFLAAEWAPLGISVHCIILGRSDGDSTTPSGEQIPGPALLGRLLSGHLSTADDLASALVYLASQPSDEASGISLLVDGSAR